MQEQTEKPGHAAHGRKGAHEQATAPSPDAGARGRDGDTQASGRNVFRTVRYGRTLRAAPSDALDALIQAVALLQYPLIETDPGANEVRFRALARTISAKVIEMDPAHCAVVIEFTAPGWQATGGSALVILPGVLLGAAVKAHDAYFARGFLSNVQRVLEGKGVGRDPARLPGMNALREKLQIGEP